MPLYGLDHNNTLCMCNKCGWMCYHVSAIDSFFKSNCIGIILYHKHHYING